MKPNPSRRFFGLLLGLALSAHAAPERSILLVGDHARIENGNTIFRGSVSVIAKDSSPRMELTADEIVFTQRDGVNVLRCSGDATLRSDGRTVRAKDLVIELGATSGNIYLLNPNGRSTGVAAEKKSAFESWPAKATPDSASNFDSRPGSLLPTGRFSGQVTFQR